MKRRSVVSNLFGLWVFGLLVGANAQDLLPGRASLPPEIMIGISLVGSTILFVGLVKTFRGLPTN